MKYVIKEIEDIEYGVPYVKGFYIDKAWMYSDVIADAYKFDSLDEAIATIVQRAQDDGMMRNGFTVVGVEEVLKPAFTEVTL